MNENNFNDENQNTIPSVNETPATPNPTLEQTVPTDLGVATPVVNTVPQETVAPVTLGANNMVNPVESAPVQPVTPVEPTATPMTNETQSASTIEQNTIPNPTGSNPETSNDNNQQTPKKSNNITMIIGEIVLLIVIVVVVYFVFIKKDNNNNNDQVIDRTKEIEEATKKAEEMDNNVNVVLLDKLSSRDFAVEIENKNSTAVTVEVNIIFYDLNGNIIDTEEVNSYVEKNSKWYKEVYVSSDSGIKNYAKAEITKKVYDWSKYSLTSSVEAKLTQGAGGKVFAQLTNKSDKIIEDAEISVLFYYQNKIVGVETVDFGNIRANASETEEVDIPWDDNYKAIQYDKVEIASTFAYNM